MPFPDNLNTAIASADGLLADLQNFVLEVAPLANRIRIDQIVVSGPIDPVDNDVAITVTMSASGLTDVNATLFQTLKESLGG